MFILTGRFYLLILHYDKSKQDHLQCEWNNLFYIYDNLCYRFKLVHIITATHRVITAVVTVLVFDFPKTILFIFSKFTYRLGSLEITRKWLNCIYINLINIVSLCGLTTSCYPCHFPRVILRYFCRSKFAHFADTEKCANYMIL